MEKKEPIKVSLSTFFLIIAIIVIAVMGYFIFNFYSQKVNLEKNASELNTKISNLEKTISNIQDVVKDTTETSVKEPIQTTSTQQEINKSYSIKDITGAYKFTKQEKVNGENIDIECILYLYDNGTFGYSHMAMIEQGIMGNYIIEDNTIILNKLFRHGNDLSLGTTKGQLRLKINEDNTITDSNNSFGIESTKNITLKKVSENEKQKYIKDDDSIVDRINACITAGTIYKGE